MSITHCKKVCPPILSQVRHHKVLILIHFIWILRAEASLSSEWKFSYTVIKLLLSCCNFSCYTRISLNRIIISSMLHLNLSWVYLHHFRQITLSWLFYCCRSCQTLLQLLTYRYLLSSLHLHTSIRSYLLYINLLSYCMINFLWAEWSCLVLNNFFRVITFS